MIQNKVIIGLAPNAWSRVVANSFIEDYINMCHKWRQETAYIARDMYVYSVQKEMPDAQLPRSNAREILMLREVQEYIKSKGNDIWLLVYKPTPGVWKLADEFGWNVIANRRDVVKDIENKAGFRDALVAAGVEPITGETMLFDDLNRDVFHTLQEKYGKKVVFQVAEMTVGGGTGTAFIETEKELDAFIKRIKEKREVLTKIEHVNAAKFITGIPASIPACVTKYGVITGRIQTQILDIPEVRSIDEGNGLFCGHDWSFRQYDENLQREAKDIAKKFGEYIGKTGYKGIFGLDLLVNEEEGKVYPVECNARFTDAFPVVSEMYLAKQIKPLDYYHVMEFLGLEYEVDVEKVSNEMNQPLYGAQIILETKTRSWTKITGDIKAGIYGISETGEIEFLKEGYRYEQLENENEFLVTEGVPFPDTVLKPGARILRLVFKKSILAQERELTEGAKNVISQVYDQLKLTEIPPQEGVTDED